MQEILGCPEASAIAVLPVDYKLEAENYMDSTAWVDNEKSDLVNFILSADSVEKKVNNFEQLKQDNQEKERSMINFFTLDENGLAPNKPVRNDGTAEMSFYGTSGGRWDDYENVWNNSYYLYFDPFDSEYPFDTYIGSTVEIRGKFLPETWNFPQQYVSLYSFYYDDGGGVNSGGGGSGGIPATECGAVDSGFNKINWSKIADFEGGLRQDGYVPLKDGVPVGKSGVTIATGFDLGQRDLGDLQALGFDDALINALKPYLGMKGTNARDYENAHSLNITLAQAQTINTAAKAATLTALTVSYDNAVGVGGAFFALPAEAQTVIASVSFQYGNLASETPTFWSQVVTKNWTGAYNELMDFKDSFATRRGKEAAILKAGLDQGHLHDGRSC